MRHYNSKIVALKTWNRCIYSLWYIVVFAIVFDHIFSSVIFYGYLNIAIESTWFRNKRQFWLRKIYLCNFLYTYELTQKDVFSEKINCISKKCSLMYSWSIYWIIDLCLLALLCYTSLCKIKQYLTNSHFWSSRG